MVAEPPVAAQAGAPQGDLCNYEYYPSAEVYYDPGQRVYFWIEAGVWRNGPVLPARIQLVGRPVMVQLRGRQPYLFHATIRTRHPPVIVRGRGRF